MSLNLSNQLGGSGEALKPILDQPVSHSESAVRHQTLQTLQTGQMISGEIVSVNGNQVELAVAGRDVILNARLHQALNLWKGQTMTFEVQKGGGGQLALRPLFENLATDANLLKALDAAKIPVNDKSLAMVDALMNEGMPIDRNTLQTVYKEILQNPGFPPGAAVGLNRLQVPVNAANLTQYGNYENLRHQILGGMESVAEQIPETFLQIASSKGDSAAMAFYGKVLGLFVGEESAAAQGKAVAGESAPAGEAAGKSPGLPAEGALDGVLSKGQLTDVSGKEAVTAKTLPWQETPVWQPADRKGVSQLLNGQARHVLADQMEAAGVPKGQTAALREGTAAPGEILKLVQGAMDNPLFARQGNTVLKNPDFSRLLRAEISSQWLLEPAEVGQEAVSKLYEKVREQTRSLMASANEFAKADTPLAKSASVLRDNVEFMNHLNQTFAYVQLPLKMQGGEAHGDLYIYTNKRNLAKKDGHITALLHLEMRHLGTMDIHVGLEAKKVHTRFYLEKEEYLDFLEGHLPELDEKLTAKGYQVSTGAMVKEQGQNVVEEMKKQAGSPVGTLLSQYAFDVRA